MAQRLTLFAACAIAGVFGRFGVPEARLDLLDAEAYWEGLLEGLPKGLPRAGDRGLDVTHTWGRTYWGGGLDVLTRLHAAQGERPAAVDLDALFRRLGVARAGGRVVYDDEAPLAAVRRALLGTARRGASRRGTGPRASRAGG